MSSARSEQSRNTPELSEYERWFVTKVRQDQAVSRLNKRQERIVRKVRQWEKRHAPLAQQQWEFARA
ncbi:MAG: hypothetical protein NC924_04245 [Candidatus Omnitrophica bacterium]|nr:hypothetical protein [Candidatus Omnitrophota bacterium]